MPEGNEIAGLTRFKFTLAEAAQKLADFTRPTTAAARASAAAARGLVPRRTGALGATISARGSRRVGIIEAGRGLDYARPVHWGAPAHHLRARPFLSRGAQSAERMWIHAFEQHNDTTLSRIKGL